MGVRSDLRVFSSGFRFPPEILDKGRQLGFVLPNEPKVCRGKVTVGTFPEIAAGESDSGSEKLNAFHV
jgi:hypothetical protein